MGDSESINVLYQQDIVSKICLFLSLRDVGSLALTRKNSLDRVVFDFERRSVFQCPPLNLIAAAGGIFRMRTVRIQPLVNETVSLYFLTAASGVETIQILPGAANVNLAHVGAAADTLRHFQCWSIISPGAADFLRACENLETIDLQSSGIENLDFLNGCPKVSQVILGHTRVSDLSPLSRYIFLLFSSFARFQLMFKSKNGGRSL